MASIEDMYYIVNEAIDFAFKEQKYNLNFYTYLQGENFTKQDITIFLESNVCTAIRDQVEEIDMYLGGGPEVADVRESYNWMGKPRARKVKEYLNSMLEDAKKYEKSKRRGRKPGSKNKPQPAANK
jgi:hypothetical protein